MVSPVADSYASSLSFDAGKFCSELGRTVCVCVCVCVCV